MNMKILLRVLFPLLFWINVSNITAQVATKEEANQIAEKWIQYTIDYFGNWNDSSSAHIESITDFTFNKRVVGYFCKINPSGYIVVSYRKELAAVKAFSDNCNINPEDMDGMSGLLKSSLFATINAIESRMGPIDLINPADLDTLLEINYASSWFFLENYRKETILDGSSNPALTDNYQTPQILLKTLWDQNAPYNNDCPYFGCTTTSNGRAYVGCVATAAAQIMRYWCWPPYGVGEPYNDPIDWVNMPATVTTSSPPAQQAAIAQLSHEIGIATNMDYGCDGSGTQTSYMVDVFPDIYHYSVNAEEVDRINYYADEWFNIIKQQINVNRPIQYKIVGHSIVADGWLETQSPFQQWYHMNYGWSGSANAWYLLDALHLGDPDIEYMIVNIYPRVSLSSPLNIGTIGKLAWLPYRYFDRDATGTATTFSSGQYLQVLPNLKITGLGTTTNIIFQGSATDNTHIFMNGDPSKGVLIGNGELRLRNGGQISLPDNQD
jgi:hypothetical protein